MNMKIRTIAVAALVLAMGGCGKKMKQESEPINSTKPTGVIGRSVEEGLPVIWKFVNEPPSDAKRQQLTWLTVVGWKYDGSSNNGMPPQEENERMLTLEDALEQHVEKVDFCEHAYSRTGNNLKEFVYYINDRETFSAALNAALKTHPRYPISITFYEDPEWKEFMRLLTDFSEKEGEQSSGHVPK
jgi:hypothetical protein